MSIVEMSVRKRTEKEQLAYDMGYQMGKHDAVKHGLWELYGDADSLSGSFFCSVCGYSIDEDSFLDTWSHMRYCPNCGAKMDLEG